MEATQTDSQKENEISKQASQQIQKSSQPLIQEEKILKS
jgi:hypothetical protein